jgi:serine/threonine protein kinase
MKAPVIAEKYTLLRKLGAGGMAEVFLAKQLGQGGFEKLVVIKRILPHLLEIPDFVDMFLDEARLAADLRHPNVVTVIDVNKTGKTYYILMEFLHGQDVRRLQRKQAQWGEMIPLGHACQVVLDAAAGLHYAHNKSDLNGKPLHIVHRDVSPQNIIVTYEGATKIVDFGIAKAAGQSVHTATGVLKGKYTYMSPEQAQGHHIDQRTDQFALGVVLWELVTMRRLFKRDSEVQTLDAIISSPIPKPSRFRSDLPKQLEELIMTSLEKDRKNRFASCEEMLTAIEDTLSELGIVHSPARLGQFMRRLFADTLAEEASLGLIRPDGSLVPDEVRLPVEEKPSEHEATRAERNKTGVEKQPVSSDDKTKKRAAPKRPTEPERRAPREERHHERHREPAPQQGPSLGDRLAGLANMSWGEAKPYAVGGGVVLAGVLAVGVVGSIVTMYRGTGPAVLVVRSDPSRATVTIDGRPTDQTTPALFQGIEAGVPHVVRVELPGHASTERTVTIPRRGETVQIVIDIPVR